MILSILKTYLRSRRFKAIGKFSIIEKGGFFHASNLDVGEGVYIGPNARFSANGGLIIKRGTIIGPNVTIFTSNHYYDNNDLQAIPYDSRTINKSVVIEENVWIGGNVVISPGAIIGEGSIIGAGEIVRGNIPPFSIYLNASYQKKRRHIEVYKQLQSQNKIYMIEKMRKYESIYNICEKIFRNVK